MERHHYEVMERRNVTNLGLEEEKDAIGGGGGAAPNRQLDG
jgi:hypothetical protein